MCQHQPPCPPADAPDHAAARAIACHPDQGWSLLCNGVVLFDDTGSPMVAPSRRIGRPTLASRLLRPPPHKRRVRTMPRIQIRKPKTTTRIVEPDLRTPSGRPLPY